LGAQITDRKNTYCRIKVMQKHGMKMNIVNKSNSFESFEEAFYKVPEFAKRLQVNVPITLEEDGTFSFFGEGQEVYEYQMKDEDLGWGR